MIKAVLFDVDGTIIDSRDLILKAFNRSLADIGEEPVTPDIFEIAKDRQLGTIGYYIDDVLGKPEKKGRMYAAHMKHYSKILQNEVQLIPGTDKAFQEIRDQGLKIGIHTMQYRAMVEIVLKRFELLVDATVAHEEVEKRKPAPDQILELCNSFEIQPEESVVVGDWVGDIRAGKAAGSKTLGVLTGLNNQEELEKEGPDRIVQNITEIPSILSELSLS